MTIVKLTAIGNSAGIILPKEILAKLRIDKGDALYLTEVPEGIMIRNYDEEFVKDMGMAERLIHENRNVLRKLSDN